MKDRALTENARKSYFWQPTNELSVAIFAGWTEMCNPYACQQRFSGLRILRQFLSLASSVKNPVV